MEIKQVKTGRQLKEFIELPFEIYKKDPYWVPPLKAEIKELLSQKNPFWKHAKKILFIAYKNGKPAGRIAGIIDDNHNRFHNEKCGFFGFFECVEDVSVSNALFEKTLNWLKEKGMEIVRGPMNPSTNDECGLLIEGFDDPPKIMMPYNPPYYIDFIQEAGFLKAKDLLAFIMDVKKGPINRLLPLAERILRRNPKLSVRKLNKKRFDEEVNIIMDIYNSAWEKNWGFVPMTEEEILYLGKKLKQIVDEDILWIAFYDGDPAGFLMALPDINEALKKINGNLNPISLLKLLYWAKKIKTLRLLTLGVKRQYHKIGLDVLLYTKSLEASLKKGYEKCEFSWILEDNIPTIRSAELMAGRIYKKYRIFEKAL